LNDLNKLDSQISIKDFISLRKVDSIMVKKSKCLDDIAQYIYTEGQEIFDYFASTSSKNQFWISQIHNSIRAEMIMSKD
jgi:hypothetical protein